ncbi:hypothetical protein GCM10017774_00720 [Lentzea cavernae]|uniref:Uncharacterized protein n=1 Tax=Lentzea cavernae TaxID=2020703 RepID=A0ABQ3LWJ8_9PSEU|nr:hypothetical protein GCM10017774_00720 [Lentzea cavernae]
MSDTNPFPRRSVLRAAAGAAGAAAATAIAGPSSALASLAGQQWHVNGKRHLTITWDEWAIPTITGKDEFDVTHGVGYAQARTNAREILDIYGRARGAAAARWGSPYLAEDRFTVQLGLKAKTDQ